MTEIRVLERSTRQEHIEQVYGETFIKALYGGSFFSFLLPLFAKCKTLSRLYGAFQKSRLSYFKIKPFIRTFKIDASEFLEPVGAFESFNDFFIRKLKASARPIVTSHDVAILPADARYRVYENIAQTSGLLIKGQKFTLSELLLDPALAQRYAQASMAIARLAPVDYHRFHFPVSCLPSAPREIPGPLYSVNPIALKWNIHILSQNKRAITTLQTKNFGTVLFIEVGATYVGTIHQTYIPEEPYAKGDEKGYFSFGGSCLIVLFEPSRIAFDQDLVDASRRGLEVLGKFGQSLGRSLSQ